MWGEQMGGYGRKNLATLGGTRAIVHINNNEKRIDMAITPQNFFQPFQRISTS